MQKLLENIELLRPDLLWLLLTVPFLIWVLRTLAHLPLAATVIRTVWVTLLCLALLEPVMQTTEESRKLTLLVDTSSSMAAKSYGGLEQYLSTLAATEGLEAEVRRFSRTPSPAQSQSIERIDFDRLQAQEASQDKSQTNLALAIRETLAQSGASSILLFSDGQETTGSAREAAKDAAAAGVRIHPLIPDERFFGRRPLVISNLHAPLVVQSGERAPVKIALQNRTPEPVRTRVELWFDEEKILERTVDIPGNKEFLLETKTEAIAEGLKRLWAVVQRIDSANVDDEQHRWISVKSKSKVLLLSGTSQDRRLLFRVLSDRGFAVEDIVLDGTKELPQNFSSISLIILNNVSKKQMNEQFLARLSPYVRQGGGLLIVGGERSFGLGGFIDTPLETLSPVTFVPPQTTKRRAKRAVLLVIDKSGSMRRGGKILAAKRSALVAIDTLRPDDFVGVIGFDTNPFLIIKLQEVKKVRPIASRRLENLVAVHQSNLRPALQLARRMLSSHPAGRKHIIVLSDGKVSGSSSIYFNEVAQLRSQGITLSGIALGSEADVPFMREISRRARGAFYHTLDPSRLPEIFIKDIKVSTGEKTLTEGSEFPVLPGPSPIESTLLRRFPDLLGFVETKPRREAMHELVVERGSKRYPLLSSWQQGRGKVAVFTSDASDRWGKLWVRWRGFAQFWRQVIDSVRPSSGEKEGEFDFDLRSAVRGDQLSLDLALFDSSILSDEDIQITAGIVEPAGEKQLVSFKPLSPGRFEANINNARAGDYKINISYGETALPPLAVTIPASAFGEQSLEGVNVSLLSDLAYLSGGSIAPEADELLGNVRVTQHTKLLFPYLLAIAFFLLLLEVFVRELGPSDRPQTSSTQVKRKRAA